MQFIKEAHPGKVLVVEPNITELPAKLESGLELVDVQSALDYANIIVLLVDHKEFKQISRDRIAALAVVDTRGVWSL
ncbi:UDP-N-acetyl-D-mannosamine dehydrogenase [compost metagenome]